MVDNYTKFSYVQNGLWNYVSNITTNADGIEMLYVPTDYNDENFQNSGSWYGTDIVGAAALSPSLMSSPLNYVLYCTGLPASTKCVQVSLFTNFEVIPTPSTAPLNTFQRRECSFASVNYQLFHEG